MFTHYKDMTDDEKCKNWRGLEGYGSPKVICIIIIRQSVYDFLFDLNRNYASILYHFRVIVIICQKLPILTHPTCICHPIRILLWF